MHCCTKAPLPDLQATLLQGLVIVIALAIVAMPVCHEPGLLGPRGQVWARTSTCKHPSHGWGLLHREHGTPLPHVLADQLVAEGRGAHHIRTTTSTPRRVRPHGLVSCHTCPQARAARVNSNDAFEAFPRASCVHIATHACTQAPR